MEYRELSNGLRIPAVGLGTWQITDREMMKQVVRDAYDCGYRLVDTAAAYSNEIAIAKAIDEAGIARSELLISDKVWNTSRGCEAVQEACKKSLKKMKTDYFDMYLIHWPASMKLYPNYKEINAETWRGMEQLYKDGYVRAIGVCNFKVHHLEELKESAEILPMINQVEFHPGFFQRDVLAYCKEKNIVLEASSPLGSGHIFTEENMINIAAYYGKSVAQTALRWGLEKGAAVIPRSTNRDRMAENIDIFDFKLNEEDIDRIDNIAYFGGIGIDSDEVTEFG